MGDDNIFDVSCNRPFEFFSVFRKVDEPSLNGREGKGPLRDVMSTLKTKEAFSTVLAYFFFVEVQMV